MALGGITPTQKLEISALRILLKSTAINGGITGLSRTDFHFRQNGGKMHNALNLILNSVA